jgi:hypothetical protein
MDNEHDSLVNGEPAILPEDGDDKHNLGKLDRSLEVCRLVVLARQKAGQERRARTTPVESF